MRKPHIQIMDRILDSVKDDIYFSKVVELDNKVIYVSYFWDIRIIIDDIKKEVVFIGNEEGYSFRWTAKTIQDILIYLNVIRTNIEGCY
ncbi:MAG: hypothetical protein J6A15_01420 [Clostridia bacterium]|nr:hypothetical protein [Clostridia bacterium]MBP3905845.1 hypothetical protein [Peptostreptococcaceae bacterium]